MHPLITEVNLLYVMIYSILYKQMPHDRVKGVLMLLMNVTWHLLKSAFGASVSTRMKGLHKLAC